MEFFNKIYNSNITQEIVDALIRDPDCEVRILALTKLHLSFEQLKIYAVETDTRILYPFVTLIQIDKKIRNEVFSRARFSQNQLTGIALSFSVTEEILWAIAAHENPDVRVHVAENSSSPPLLLQTLTEDRNEYVASAARGTLIVQKELDEMLKGVILK